MPKSIIRIAAFLLVPCLAAGPSLASVLSSRQLFKRLLSATQHFGDQALSEELSAASFFPDRFKARNHLKLIQIESAAAVPALSAGPEDVTPAKPRMPAPPAWLAGVFSSRAPEQLTEIILRMDAREITERIVASLNGRRDRVRQALEFIAAHNEWRASRQTSKSALISRSASLAEARQEAASQRLSERLQAGVSRPLVQRSLSQNHRRGFLKRAAFFVSQLGAPLPAALFDPVPKPEPWLFAQTVAGMTRAISEFLRGTNAKDAIAQISGGHVIKLARLSAQSLIVHVQRDVIFSPGEMVFYMFELPSFDLWHEKWTADRATHPPELGIFRTAMREAYGLATETGTRNDRTDIFHGFIRLLEARYSKANKKPGFTLDANALIDAVDKQWNLIVDHILGPGQQTRLWQTIQGASGRLDTALPRSVGDQITRAMKNPSAELVKVIDEKIATKYLDLAPHEQQPSETSKKEEELQQRRIEDGTAAASSLPMLARDWSRYCLEVMAHLYSWSLDFYKGRPGATGIPFLGWEFESTDEFQGDAYRPALHIAFMSWPVGGEIRLAAVCGNIVVAWIDHDAAQGATSLQRGLWFRMSPPLESMGLGPSLMAELERRALDIGAGVIFFACPYEKAAEGASAFSEAMLWADGWIKENAAAMEDPESRHVGPGLAPKDIPRIVERVRSLARDGSFEKALVHWGSHAVKITLNPAQRGLDGPSPAVSVFGVFDSDTITEEDLRSRRQITKEEILAAESTDHGPIHPFPGLRAA